MRGIVFILLVFAGHFSLVVFLNKQKAPDFVLPKATTQETLNLDGLPEGGLATGDLATTTFTKGYWMVIEGPPKTGPSHNWKFTKEMQGQIDDL